VTFLFKNTRRLQGPTGTVYALWASGDGALYYAFNQPGSEWSLPKVVLRENFDNGGTVCLSTLPERLSTGELCLEHISWDESVKVLFFSP